ncbi:MAG: beta-galactosidase trimerization domain-containing protein [Kiritimatiellae bacterium]|nr:beta-galactosidase trimerization domain-containing protein [Kiritimatiellia bacterium]
MSKSKRVSLGKPPAWMWKSRWASYWFGDKELLTFTDRDLDRKAAKLARAGVNAVITFGSLHFRWNFTDDWPRLLVLLRKICRSCHAHGIKVVEHHSAILTSNPLGEEEWRLVGSGHFNVAQVHLKNHPGFLRHMQMGDAFYEGVRLSSLWQIDPRTGQYARSQYHGFVQCFNNPEWQRLYFRYLEDVYRCGIDGIMTDDIAFFPMDYGCGCIYCRTLFNEATGYTMPPTGLDDKAFYGNLDNPAYRAWVLWRIDCHRAHQERLVAHFHKHGYKLVRPIYTSSNANAFGARGMGSSLDNLDGLYSVIFTEVNASDLQTHCWLRIGAESKQRNALAARNRVPPMCLFYPNNTDENLFCWGMTKSWGQVYWGTNERVDAREQERMLRMVYSFEAAHPRLYDHPQPVAEVGVLFSTRTVWLHKDGDQAPDYVRMSDPASTDCWAGWCETLMLANIPFDTVLETDLAEGRYLDRLRLLILPNAVCLSTRQRAMVERFVRRGGCCVVTHQTGLKDETGAWRREYPLSALVGADYVGVLGRSPAWKAVKKAIVGAARVPALAVPMGRFKPYKGTDVWMTLADGSGPAVFRQAYGKGQVVTFAGKPGRIVCVNRHPRMSKGGVRFARVDFAREWTVETVMSQVVRGLLGSASQVVTSGVPRGVVISLHGNGQGNVLHIVNAAGTLADDRKVGRMPLPLNFPQIERLPGGSRQMIIKVRCEGRQAVLRSPEFRGERPLVCQRENACLVISMPSAWLRCYGVIEIV